VSAKPLHVRFLLSRIITSSLLLGIFMQFAFLFSKIWLAYFIDLFLLIFLHGLAGVPFLILPVFPYTRQSVVGRAPSHDVIYIVLSTMLCSVLYCGVFFHMFCHILHFIYLWFKYFCCVIFGLPHLDMCCYYFIFIFWVEISLIITSVIIIIIICYHLNVWCLQLCTWKSQSF
jgi:hypothetical protein